MRIMKRFSKISTTGKIVKTVLYDYRSLRAENPDLSEEDILKTVFENRYRRRKIKEERFQCYLFTGADPKTFRNLQNLCMGILNIEKGINVTNPRPYIIASQIIEEKIKARGLF